MYTLAATTGCSCLAYFDPEKSIFYKAKIDSFLTFILINFLVRTRVSVQGVKSLGGHFALLCRGFDFYEVKKNKMLLFFKKKREILLHF
jgi:hypothetical protein